MAEEIVNRVAASALEELNLEDYFPKEKVVVFDLKPFLFMELILKEKDFREALKNFDFSIYQDKYVAITCTADAIIPMWAYMLVVAYAQPFAKDIIAGDASYVHKSIFLKRLATVPISDYADKRVVIKGCGDLDVAEFAYVEITKLLRPVAKSIMYGEPCSTVPIFKKR